MAAAKPKPNKKRLRGLKVAMEVSRTDLHLLLVDETSGTPVLRARHVTWAQDDMSLDSEHGQAALTRALCELAVSEQITGAQVKVTLNSDFCLTRVLMGENEEVRREVKSLDDRSSLYLSLGAGENTFAVCTQALDARHQQAFVTIANKQMVNAIRHALTTAGFGIELLEHSLVSLARALGILQLDAEEPVLVLEINRRGVELGISYHGQLMLDYRPGGTATKEHVAQTVIRHLERLQRYCNKRFPFASGKLTRIYLCGNPDDVQLACQQFAEQDRLQAAILDTQELLTRCGLPLSNEAQTNFTPSIGVLAHGSQPDLVPTPNLMGRSPSELTGTPWGALIRTAWPVAAALVLLAGVYSATVLEQMRCNWLESEFASLDATRKRLNELQMQINLVRQETDQLSSIVEQVRPLQWHRLLVTISETLPEGVWLERLSVDAEGAVRLIGPSQSEDGIFELVRLLKEVPQLNNVALESTQPIQFNSIPATRFDITCRLASIAAEEAEKK